MITTDVVMPATATPASHAHDQDLKCAQSKVTILAPIPHRTRSNIPAAFQTSTSTAHVDICNVKPQAPIPKSILGPTPQLTTCPTCTRPILTVCQPVAGRAFTLGMMVSAALVPVAGVGCVVGGVLAACKPAHDILHKCPRCLSKLGRWRRL